MTHIRLSLLAALLASLAVCTVADAAAPRINCKAPYHRDMDLEPVGAGPLTLAAVYCQMIFADRRPSGEPVMAPDASAIAYSQNDMILRAARLAGHDRWTDYPAEMGTFARFGHFRSVPAFVWASDSQGLWTATQDRLPPSNFATGPLRPV